MAEDKSAENIQEINEEVHAGAAIEAAQEEKFAKNGKKSKKHI